MGDAFTRPFTKAEMDAMRKEAGGHEAPGGGPFEGSSQDQEGLVRSFWTKLRRVSGRIPFAEDLVAAYYCATDPTTPNRVRLILMGAIAYFVLPTDAIADFLALFGFADDAAVLATALTQVAGSITDAHRAKARQILLKGVESGA